MQIRGFIYHRLTLPFPYVDYVVVAVASVDDSYDDVADSDNFDRQQSYRFVLVWFWALFV